MAGLVKKVQDMRQARKANVRGGVGELAFSYLFEESELGDKAAMVAKVTLEPGQSIGEHTHDEDGELYIVVSGKGMVNDNGVPREVCAGDAVWTTGGELHSVINHGDETLVLYAIVIL